MKEIINLNKNKHLTHKDRDFIFKLKIEGRSLRYIAEIIGRDKSTVSRELKRNKSIELNGEYLPSEAHKLSVKRKSEALKGNKIRDLFTKDFTINKLKLGWSPEQISGRLNIKHPKHYVCTETIYSWIYDLRTREVVGEDLSKYLTYRHPKRRKKGAYRKINRTSISNKTPIELRPQEVNERKTIGNWETDLIVSGQSIAALSTTVERLAGYTILSKLANRTAPEKRKSIINDLKEFPSELIQTVTADNGSENAEHEKVTKVIGIQYYFANPYHSWERGTNENTNGLIRRYFPKKTDFKKVTDEQVRYVQEALNNRPRKRLGFRTPQEVMDKYLSQIKAA